jgi:hypothetical protein
MILHTEHYLINLFGDKKILDNVYKNRLRRAYFVIANYFLASSCFAGSVEGAEAGAVGTTAGAGAASTGLASSFLPQATRAVAAMIANKTDFI